MDKGTLEEDTSTPDLADIENSMWSDLDQGESQGKDTEGPSDSEPASDDNGGAPEGSQEEGRSQKTGDGPATDKDDDIPLDGDQDSDDEGVEDDIPLDEDDGEDGDSREPDEELTVKNAESRIKSAQDRMHDATKEASSYRKELEIERQKREELEAKFNETLESIDKGNAKTSREMRREKIMANLSDEQKENFELYGDMIELVLDIVDPASKEGTSKADSASGDNRGKAESQEQQAKIDTWRDGVLDQAPEWFDTINTPEWQEFAQGNPKFMQQVMDRYDNLDPRGAVKMYKGFQSWKERSAKAPAKRPTKTATPRGRTAASPADGGPPIMTRERIEAEAWKELGG